MEYHLRFSINYDETHWNRETYQEDKRRFYTYLIKSMKARDAKIEDWYIEFRNGTPEFAEALSQQCRADGYNFDLWVFPSYSREEIRTARFVPLGARYEPVDDNDNGAPLNSYPDTICETCGSCDQNNVPIPYKISNEVLIRRRDIANASNGIVILSDKAFKLLKRDIEPWISWGYVEIVDKNNIVEEGGYVWIRPKIAVGRYIDSKVIKRCDKCDRPIEVRWNRSKDIFNADKKTVESFKNVKAPIVLAGNWYGEISASTAGDVHRDVFVSGSLHEKIRKLQLRGFSKANRVIHAADEPYEWDPLGHRHY